MKVVKDTKFHHSVKTFVVESGALRMTDPCYINAIKQVDKHK